MLALLIGIIGIILTIFFVVGVHEFGHFIVARLLGVKVLRFSLGFGKALWRWTDKKGTEYVFAAIPLGGYVKMLDEHEGPVSQEDLSVAYNTQPIYKKLAIVVAGPLANLIFAFVIYWCLFMVGFVGMIPFIGKIQPDSIAAQAGMKPNQEIIRVDNEATNSWMSVIVNLITRAGDTGQLSVTTQDLPSQQKQTYLLNLDNWRMNDLKPDPLESLGIIPYEPDILPIIGSIATDSTARSLLQRNDKVIAINNVPIPDWRALSLEIDKNPETILQFKIQRDTKILVIPIKTSYQRDYLFHKHGYIGLAPAFEWPSYLLRKHQYGPIKALIYAWQETKVFVAMNFIVLGKLLTGKVSLASLGGPITIFQGAGTALNHGLLPFFSFVAFLSIAIGLVNVLPIPGLDGGHVLFQLIEVIIRRPLPIKVQILFYRLGLIVLLLLVSQAMVNDILRL